MADPISLAGALLVTQLTTAPVDEYLGAMSAPALLRGEVFAKTTRTAGSFRLRNARGEPIHVVFAGSTHDWDRDFTAVAREVEFLETAPARAGRPKCEAILAEQTGGDHLLALAEAGLANLRLESGDVLPTRFARLKALLANTEIERTVTTIDPERRVTSNVDLMLSVSGLEHIYQRSGRARVYDVLYEALSPLTATVDFDPRVKNDLLALGDWVLAQTSYRRAFAARPFSRDSNFARAPRARGFITPAELGDEVREEWMARRLRAARGPVCFVAHSSHVLAVVKRLRTSISDFRVDAIEPNRDLERHLEENPWLCRERWPRAFPSRYACPLLRR